MKILTVRTFLTNCWQGGMFLRSRLKTASENANEFRCNDNYIPKFFHKQPNCPNLQKTATFIDFGKDGYSDIEVVTV